MPTAAELSERSHEIQNRLATVAAGAVQIKEEVDATSRDLEDLHACEHDAELGHELVEELVGAGAERECFASTNPTDALH